MTSSLEPQPILVRCRRFQVQVTFDPFGGLSPLEEHLLLGIASGEGSVDHLAQAFGLPKRLVLDACVELLRAGMLVIKADRLEVAPVVQQRIGRDPRAPTKGWARSFESAAPPGPETVVLLQELLSGSLLPPPGGPSIREPRPPEAPIHPEVSRPEEVSTLDLLLALGRVRTTRRDEDSRARRGQMSSASRIREARLVRPIGGVTAPAASLDTTIVVSLVCRQPDMLSDPPRFGIIGPDVIPTGVRRRMALALSDLWQRGHGRGPKQFFTRLDLSGGVDEDDGVPPLTHPIRAAQRLQHQWNEARGQAPAQVHASLSDLERDTADELAEAVQYGASIVIDPPTDGRRSRIVEALEQAEQQVVITAAAELAQDAEFLAQVKSTAERGVSVFLLGPESRELHEMANALESHRRTERGGHTIVATGRIDSGARVVVCDIDWVHVAGTSMPRGVRLGTRREGVVARAVVEIVGWLRTQVPDVRQRRMLLDSPALFGRRFGDVELLPEMSAPAEGGFAQLWETAWSHRVDEHARSVERALPLAIPVCDGAHRELLSLAIQSSQQRLVIAAGNPSPTSMPTPLVRDLGRAARRGVKIRIVLGPQAHWGPDLSTQRAQLEGVGIAFEDRLASFEALVCDDWCLVGSYRYSSSETSARRELSVRVFGDEIVDTVAGAI